LAQQERKAIIAKIEETRKSRVICCLTSDRQNASGFVAKDFIPIFFNHLRSFGSGPLDRIDVFLFTAGGDTLAAFGLSRLVREFANSVGVLIPEKCHSAGTLFALGADDIVMTKAATLSPIDPSVNGPLNPILDLGMGQRQPIAVSVESVAGFKALVRDEWKLDDEAVGAAFKILAEKVHPLLLGDVFRRRQQIERLAETLLHNHRKGDEQVASIIDTLTKKLGSHDYLIARREARDLMGKQIAADNLELEALIWSLYEDFAAEMKLGQIFDPASIINAARLNQQQPPIKVVNKVVVIESRDRSDAFEHEIALTDAQMMTPAGPTKLIQQEAIRVGWGIA
jgi:hypothetical protein